MRRVWLVVAGLLCSGATLVTPSTAAPPNAPPPDVPLVDAVRRGDADAVRALLDGGAYVDSTTPDGATALLWAVHTDQPELVGLLLEAGADVEITNRYGVGPASLAAENGNPAILERLLQAGVYADHSLPGGETLLMTAARTGEPETVRTLLAHGADPNLREMTRGQTALMWAAAHNNAAAIQVLAEQGADINAKTDNPSPSPGRTFAYAPPTGFTPLMFAVRAGHIDATRVLLDAGADVNGIVSDGQSALVVAAANANWELAAYLLDHGADVTQAGAGWNALHQTVRTRRMNVGFGTPGPFSSGTLDSIDLIRMLLAAGVDVNVRMTRNGMRDGQRNRFNRLGATAFMLAAKVTDVEVMRLLLEAGADPTIPTADGTTTLMVAAGLAIWNPGEDGGSLTGQEAEVLEAVRISLEGGNDVNARNYRGETALHGVGFRGVNIVVDYLVEQGADLTVLTVDGWSALAIARGLSYTDFYKAQVHTAARLEELMQARELETEGEAHRVPGSVCYDCLQTRRDQIRAVAERDEWMESNFDPTSRAIQMMPGWTSLPIPQPPPKA
jgi:ankyrin repeat protein